MRLYIIIRRVAFIFGVCVCVCVCMVAGWIVKDDKSVDNGNDSCGVGEPG